MSEYKRRSLEELEAFFEQAAKTHPLPEETIERLYNRVCKTLEERKQASNSPSLAAHQADGRRDVTYTTSSESIPIVTKPSRFVRLGQWPFRDLMSPAFAAVLALVALTLWFHHQLEDTQERMKAQQIENARLERNIADLDERLRREEAKASLKPVEQQARTDQPKESKKEIETKQKGLKPETIQANSQKPAAGPTYPITVGDPVKQKPERPNQGQGEVKGLGEIRKK